MPSSSHSTSTLHDTVYVPVTLAREPNTGDMTVLPLRKQAVAIPEPSPEAPRPANSAAEGVIDPRPAQTGHRKQEDDRCKDGGRGALHLPL
jgi:hypothetical protein